ncbi:MAG: NYN domain-containing protein [Salinivirgaceae bacterium]|nr:NYN domain-containing protein [Salinivirgaceae bacterium]
MAKWSESKSDVKFTSMAVLIDGENVDKQKIEPILAKISQFGTITTKRVYGDWSQEKLKLWNDTVSVCALRTMHHFVHSKQKNTTDIAMVIDAMDLLHTGLYDAFVIVSSDGDFSNLAVRIRNEDKVVIGVGQNKTNYNFVSICNIFINQDKLASSVDTANPMRLKNKVETLNSKMAEKDKTIKAQAAKMKEKNKAMSDLRKELSTVKKELRAATGGTKKLESQLAKLQKNNESLKKKVEVAKARLTAKTTKKFIDLLLNAISGEEIGENKYPLDIIGKKIREENPTFRPSDYGFPTLSKLLASTPGVKVTTEQNRVLFSMSNDLAKLN